MLWGPWPSYDQFGQLGGVAILYFWRKNPLPGDSKCPFHPLVGGHLTIPKRSLNHPKKVTLNHQVIVIVVWFFLPTKHLQLRFATITFLNFSWRFSIRTCSKKKGNHMKIMKIHTRGFVRDLLGRKSCFFVEKKKGLLRSWRLPEQWKNKGAWGCFWGM